MAIAIKKLKNKNTRVDIISTRHLAFAEQSILTSNFGQLAEQLILQSNFRQLVEQLILRYNFRQLAGQLHQSNKKREQNNHQME